jgi:cytochrome b6-f complex iron-sulfur subunit
MTSSSSPTAVRATTRREFLCSLGAAGVASAALTALPACEVAQLREGSSGEFTFDLADPTYASLALVGGMQSADALGHKIVIVRVSNQEFVALDRLCTHVFCDMGPDMAGHWDKAAETLTCVCHDSVFAKDGHVLAGPATEALKSYPVVVTNGIGLVTL